MRPPEWSTACPDWEARITDGRPLIALAPLFPEEANAALDVFKSLRMVDVAGKPTFGEACDQWVFDFVGAIFGAYDPKSARRLISEFMLLISKKNGKSTIAAAIMLTALILNWRHEAELLILAPTLEVAGNSFNPAAAMVRADPELTDLLHVQEHVRTIRHRVTNATLKIVAAEAETASGKKAGFVLIEELWLFGKKPKAAAMLSEALGGLAARPEGFVIYITTHSDEPPAGVMKDRLAYFRDVRDGIIEDRASLPVLYEWPQSMLDDESYLDPANFRVTNPNLGRSVTAEWLIRKWKQEQIGEGEGLQIFLAKHLNVEIGLRLRRDRWRGADHWEDAADPTLTLEELLRRCEVAVVGIDGGGLDDLFGLCVAGRERGTDRWLFWCKAWAQREVLFLRKEIASVLQDFEKDGDLVLCDGEIPEPEDDGSGKRVTRNFLEQDIAEIVDTVEQVKDSGLLPERGAVGLDPQGVATLVDALTGIGLTQDQLWPIGQGFRLMSAVLGVARKLKFRRAVHNGSRMMAWCVSNAKEEIGRQSVMIVKNAPGGAKIDPFIALLNAARLLEMNPEAANEGSVYDEREMVVL
ncbi:MAG: terminase [Sphingomonas sp.]|nr:terminase [Sphingomonas sp.]|tara:strand:- start:2329 stop:4077 length:1749 start_codon:yes stop_codon:yes gene_type:complete